MLRSYYFRQMVVCGPPLRKFLRRKKPHPIMHTNNPPTQVHPYPSAPSHPCPRSCPSPSSPRLSSHLSKQTPKLPLPSLSVLPPRLPKPSPSSLKRVAG